MQFENITIKYSILNIQVEKRTAGDFWDSSYLIYDHNKSAIVFSESLENDTTEFNGNLKTILNGIKSFLNMPKMNKPWNKYFISFFHFSN
jgi:hypothetical protein